MTRAVFRTRIKFCGMTRAEDLRLAGEFGVDAVGFVFVPGSPRRLEPAQARDLREGLMPLVDVVALFMDSPAEYVHEVVRQVRPDLLQFHGGEDDAYCRSFGLPYLKAIAMGDGRCESAAALQARHPGASAFLFDSHGTGAHGGSGRSFDWSALPAGLERPFMLAGGLGPDNVFDAVRRTRPWGVDVSSGIERAPGVKDGDKMRRFVEEVRRADCHTD
ncbi:phosphoribosylanthranilate isomerase [Vulcaniibacterium gelatinicum]|uniref:phosphoribosylanthranilate isomerase n=1 Tax=Vulcaniibacterium gelatinicum TaxID=2598725 RepID=UPI0011C8DB7A|nr:phosphoribosylanthranilate isomerase [Vulcaniibacterium gelatinicum]